MVSSWGAGSEHSAVLITPGSHLQAAACCRWQPALASWGWGTAAACIAPAARGNARTGNVGNWQGWLARGVNSASMLRADLR